MNAVAEQVRRPKATPAKTAAAARQTAQPREVVMSAQGATSSARRGSWQRLPSRALTVLGWRSARRPMTQSSGPARMPTT